MFVNPLPAAYLPFPKLAICSNVFENVSIPLAINGSPLVLIGSGPQPLVWIAAPSAPNSLAWVFVVKESKAVFPGITVISAVETSVVSVMVGKVEVLRVTATSADSAEVSILDLRPLGLDVSGDRSGLKIGTNTFARSGVVGARVGIDLSVPNAQMVVT